jgi:transglutaminase-like putative cysteine protease
VLAVQSNLGPQDSSDHMHFHVEHSTRYSYDVPVSLGPHVIRLLPRLPQGQLLNHTLQVGPEPIERQVVTDLNGNQVLRVVFTGETQEFTCVSRLEAETTVLPSIPNLRMPLLPWARTNEVPPSLQDTSPGTHVVTAFAEAQSEKAGRQTLPFLESLNQTLYENIDRHTRLTGNAQTPEETLVGRRGACRDITMLFIATCRAQGIAARFVSGYQFAADTPDGQRQLHAWPEVFIPGCGWRGFDPTQGTAVTDGHVALCHGAQQSQTMPVEGGFTFAGTVVNSTLQFSIQVQVYR